MRILLLLLVLAIPTKFAQAIPPPDLLINAFQLTLTALGALAATIVISLYWLKDFALTVISKYKHWLLASLVILVVLTALVFVCAHQKDTETQNQIDSDITALMDELDAVSSAKSERSANVNLRMLPGAMSWEFFSENYADDAIILDVRERTPYERSHIPGSINIRFTDLITGRWKELPKDTTQPIYVVCYNGTTGALTTEFLRSKGFENVFRPNGGLIASLNTIPLTNKLYAPRSETRPLYKRVSSGTDIDSEIFTIDMRVTAQPAVEVDDHFVYWRENQETIDSFIVGLPDTDIQLVCGSEVDCYTADVFTVDAKAVGKNISTIYELQ